MKNYFSFLPVIEQNLFVLIVCIICQFGLHGQQPGPLIGRLQVASGGWVPPSIWNHYQTGPYQGMLVKTNPPYQSALTVRDFSGMYYRRVQSATPNSTAYFIDWQGRLIQLNPFGATIVGSYIGQAPLINPYMSAYANTVFHPTARVDTPSGYHRIPQAYVDSDNPYGRLLYVSKVDAEACYVDSLNNEGDMDKETFKNCVLEKMVSRKDYDAITCMQNASSEEERILCAISSYGGNREREIAGQLMDCYRQYGNDYEKYALCLLSKDADSDTAQLLSCIQQQSRTGDISALGVMACYGANHFDMNTESQIMVECAVTTGGEPLAFAGCAGGRMTVNELDKCFTSGVGGENGCFGDNNTIIRALNGIGRELPSHFGNSWNNAVNDLTKGPGPGNDAIKTLRKITNEAARTPGNIIREAGNVFKKIGF